MRWKPCGVCPCAVWPGLRYKREGGAPPEGRGSGHARRGLVWGMMRDSCFLRHAAKGGCLSAALRRSGGDAEVLRRKGSRLKGDRVLAGPVLVNVRSS